MIAREWHCAQCGCVVSEVRSDRSSLRFFEVEMVHEGVRMWMDFHRPNMDECIAGLDEGACPVCDEWQDVSGDIVAPFNMDEVVE